MLLDGLWTVHALLALSSFALGNPVSNDPLAAPRVFISFKGRNYLFAARLLILLYLTLLIPWGLRHLCRVCARFNG